jgi:hypothetical protein
VFDKRIAVVAEIAGLDASLDVVGLGQQARDAGGVGLAQPGLAAGAAVDHLRKPSEPAIMLETRPQQAETRATRDAIDVLQTDRAIDALQRARASWADA